MTPNPPSRSRWRPARRAAAASTLAATALLTAACGSTEQNVSSAATAPDSPPQELRMATSFAIESVDPLKEGFWSPEFGYGELLMRPSSDGVPKPWLLKDLRQVDDRTWKLTLRDGVTFHDGNPLDAVALVAVLRRQLREGSAAKATLPGSKATASGPLQVTFTTKKPEATLPHIFADESQFPIYDAKAAEAAGDSAEKMLAAGIYTGPYRPTALNSREMSLEAYPKYWGGTPPLPGVKLRFIPDAEARILAVRNGEADIALYPPTAVKRTLEGRTDAFYVTPPQGVEGIRVPLNQRSGPFADVAVRQAFSLGIDYASLADDVMDGAYDAAVGMYAKQLDFAVANQQTDTAKAAALLDGAGWRAASGGVREKDGKPLAITLLVYPQQPDLRPLAVAVQAQLKAVGFDVKIQEVDDIDAAMRERSGWDAGLVFSGSVGFNGDPVQPLKQYLASTGESNYGGVDDDQLDQISSDLAETFDPAKRKALLAEAQDIVIAKQAYQVFLAVKRFPAVVGPAYRGYVPSTSLTHITVQTGPSAG